MKIDKYCPDSRASAMTKHAMRERFAAVVMWDLLQQLTGLLAYCDDEWYAEWETEGRVKAKPDMAYDGLTAIIRETATSVKEWGEAHEH